MRLFHNFPIKLIIYFMIHIQNDHKFPPNVAIESKKSAIVVWQLKNYDEKGFHTCMKLMKLFVSINPMANHHHHHHHHQRNSHSSVAKLPYNHVRDFCFYAVAVYLRKVLFPGFEDGVKRRVWKKKSEADS